MNYIIIFVALITLEFIYFRIADKYNIIDKPNLRSSHINVTLRGGGIIFLLGMWVYSIFFDFQYAWFMAGLTAIAGVSFVDDIRGVSNRIRLVFQFLAVSFMFQQLGILNSESWWIIIVALILCVGIINAYNFMDGINGITGAYSLAVLLPLLYVNQNVQFIDSNLLIVIIISLLIFLFFNFRTRAKCFAGDVGAVGIAYIILFSLGSLIIKTGKIEYIIFLAIYGVDTVLTIIHRIKLGEKIGEAHRKHAYQLMANELKMQHRLVTVIYTCLQLIISFGIIFCPINSWTYFTIVIMLLSIAYILFKKKFYHLHEEYLNK